MESSPLPRIVFGLAVPESITRRDAGLGTLLRWLGTRVGVEVVRFQVPSYEALAQQMRDGTIHVAWLPPIVFVWIERARPHSWRQLIVAIQRPAFDC